MHRVLIVAISSIVEIVAIPIIVDLQVNGRKVPGRIVIVRRLVVNVKLSISLSILIVLVVSGNFV